MIFYGVWCEDFSWFIKLWCLVFEVAWNVLNSMTIITNNKTLHDWASFKLIPYKLWTDKTTTRETKNTNRILKLVENRLTLPLQNKTWRKVNKYTNCKIETKYSATRALHKPVVFLVKGKTYDDNVFLITKLHFKVQLKLYKLRFHIE